MVSFGIFCVFKYFRLEKVLQYYSKCIFCALYLSELGVKEITGTLTTQTKEMLLLFEPFKFETTFSDRFFTSSKNSSKVFEIKVTMKYKSINGKEDIYLSSQIKRTMLTHHRKKKRERSAQSLYLCRPYCRMVF